MATAPDSDEGLNAELQRARRSLVAHEWLLRALLTHLAMTDPQAFQGLIGGFTHSRRYAEPGPGGDLTREVADKLTALLRDVAGGAGRG